LHGGNYLWIIGNPLFFAQYWLFASKYSNTAYEVPFILDGRDVSEEPVKFFYKKSTQTLILVANIVLSSINGYYYAKEHSGSPTQR
jgi:bisphosphoglycerate-independent phosphoglycerate mutase (AlkP superfamily)